MLGDLDRPSDLVKLGDQDRPGDINRPVDLVRLCDPHRTDLFS